MRNAAVERARFRTGCAVLALALVSGCGGSAPTTTPTASATTRQASQAGEPGQGLALVRAQGYQSARALGGGDGSLLLVYASDAGTACYYRRVAPDGTVSGSYRRGEGCRDVRAHGSGYVGLAASSGGSLPLQGAVDLTDPAHPVPVAADDRGRTPGAGDVYLGWCGDLSSPEARNPNRRGCAYAPGGHTFYRLRPALTIDPAGRVWRAGPGHALTVSYGATSWPELALAGPGWSRVTPPFGSEPESLLGSSGPTAVVWLAARGHPRYVTNDVGATWHQVTTGTDEAQSPEFTKILPDGRLLLGPGGGAFWRATDSTNRHFETHVAGPIRTVVSAGDRLYGLSDGTDSRVFGYVWTSTDGGSTWRAVIEPKGAVSGVPAAPASALRVQSQTSVDSVVAKYPPSKVAVAGDGLVLVIYSDSTGIRPAAWRLYDRQDRVLAQGLNGAWSVATVGDSFLLSTDDGAFVVDQNGAQTLVDDQVSERLPVRAGDVYVRDRGVLRPATPELFTGVARPNGTVSAMDGQGRMWALGRHTPGRTVVRWASPGGPWHSRDLGPAIGAETILGRGSVLTVTGPQRLYVSGDAGRTWSLLTHGAGVYSGLPFFDIQPDGSIIGGDYRGGIRISDDLRTFRAPTPAEDELMVIGDVFARPAGRVPEISVDRRHWLPFSPAAVRQLLAP